MARVNYEKSKEFDAQGTFDVFNLENDQDSDRVQFLMNSINDVLAYTTHGVMAKSARGADYERKVGCLLTSKDDPVGTCPLCDNGSKIKVARFIPLYSHTHKKVMLWERGTRFIDQTLAGLFNRLISQGVNPSQTVIEIVRNGKKGDTGTTYALYPMEKMPAVDITALEIPEPSGTLIADWSKADMIGFITTGQMPQNTNNANDGVQRRERPVDTGYATPAYANTGMAPSANVNMGAPADNFTTTADPTQLF